MSDSVEMQKHEKRCREQNDSLIYCAEQINMMAGLATAAGFGLVAELYGEDGKPAYYKVKGAEAEAAKRRCKITFVYESEDKAAQKRADKKTK